MGSRGQATPCLAGSGVYFTPHLGRMEPLEVSGWRPDPICSHPCCSVENRWGGGGEVCWERVLAGKWVRRLFNPSREGLD